MDLCGVRFLRSQTLIHKEIRNANMDSSFTGERENNRGNLGGNPIDMSIEEEKVGGKMGMSWKP